MSVTPDDLLKHALELASHHSDEITQRNVISRAYYAAYHRACEFIKPERQMLGDAGMHKQYITQLNQGKSCSIERKIGGKIKTMHVRRITADYRIREDVPNSNVAIQISAAKELFSIIDNYKPDPSTDIPPPPASSGHLRRIK
ncbi:hypothetical protein [Candidatus Nitrotoga fabula]|uniref:HEPN domain-containing protein n=1 Tax=Candidatus Nitrotoga fabula TaxID=2182327 RepID=A0A916BCT0_9PROT|nr:hypothetical protein [Candidatus Nitrotoga fabula]CAE6723461.1 conserved hypothetical protein [Candidatus Nitrotoga fabula]